MPNIQLTNNSGNTFQLSTLYSTKSLSLKNFSLYGTVHGKILVGEKLANLWIICQNFPRQYSRINIYTENVFVWHMHWVAYRQNFLYSLNFCWFLGFLTYHENFILENFRLKLIRLACFCPDVLLRYYKFIGA